MLRPLRSTIADPKVELRPDSGTLATDSVVMRARQNLAMTAAQVVSQFNDREFQADVWPNGAAAMARWREQERPDQRATPEEQVRSDSLIAVLEAHGICEEASTVGPRKAKSCSCNCAGKQGLAQGE